jgi:hypothetical protein
MVLRMVNHKYLQVAKYALRSYSERKRSGRTRVLKIRPTTNKIWVGLPEFTLTFLPRNSENNMASNILWKSLASYMQSGFSSRSSRAFVTPKTSYVKFKINHDAFLPDSQSIINHLAANGTLKVCLMCIWTLCGGNKGTKTGLPTETIRNSGPVRPCKG